MVNIKIPKPWDRIAPIPEDKRIYLKRREILKQLGILGVGMMGASLWSACEKDVPGTDLGEETKFTFEGMDQLYPAGLNSAYSLDRPLTAVYEATHHNNFYEFISPDDANIYNAYKYVRDFDNRDWNIEVAGFAENTGSFYLGDLIQEMGLEERTYRHRCVEAWAMAVPWTGFSLAKLINFLKPSDKATHIRMVSYGDEDQMIGIRTQDWYPWPYFEGLRMEEAMNELAFVATGLYGEPLPKQNGAPVRLVVPWKYGYKSIKSIVKIEFIDFEPETFWHQTVPNEYGFLSNVEPDIPHPRWSQATEVMLGTGDRRQSQRFNGYGEFVAHLY